MRNDRSGSDESGQLMRRYTFKLYPNDAQDAALMQQSRMMAALWNAALEQREIHWSRQTQKHGDWETESYLTKSGQIKTIKKRRGLTAMTQALSIKDLRASCPEWAAINATTPLQVLFQLEEAFNAFFKRAKNGRGKESGYPRYKRVADGMSIPFGKIGNGWRISTVQDIYGKSGRLRATTNYAAKNWRLYIKGVPGLIKVRGKFPISPSDIRDAIIMRRDDCWWISVVATMRPRRVAGYEKLRVEFDLIDEFARIERANGRCPAASQEGIIGQSQYDTMVAGVATGNLSGDDRLCIEGDSHRWGVATGDLSGDDRTAVHSSTVMPGVATGNLSGDDRWRTFALTVSTGVATDNLSGDNRLNEKCGGALDGAANFLEKELRRAQSLCERADKIKSERDLRFVRKPFRKPSRRWRRETKRAAKITAKAARIRRNALHQWSHNIVSIAKNLTVIAPKIKDNTRSPRGDKHQFGAATGIVSKINRNTLNHAPATAANVLAYKAEEAGIRCVVVTDDNPAIAVGEKLVAAGKSVRKLKRAIRRQSQ